MLCTTRDLIEVQILVTRRDPGCCMLAAFSTIRVCKAMFIKSRYTLLGFHADGTMYSHNICARFSRRLAAVQEEAVEANPRSFTGPLSLMLHESGLVRLPH